MKVSKMTITDVAKYMNLEEDEYDTGMMEVILLAAKEYVADYTGIPQHIEGVEGNTLDDYEKFPLAVMVLCQDMYDNRSYYVERANVNKVVESILNMHRRNYL